jgi:CBS domain containing-hemolysin-like protein
LVEEIVGEIRDETDVEKTVFQHVDKDTIVTNGEIEIDTLNQIFKTNVPEGDDYASLNGLLHEKLHDIPKEGDKIEVNSLRIIVEKVFLKTNLKKLELKKYLKLVFQGKVVL